MRPCSCQDWHGKHWLSWTSSVSPPRGICQASFANQWVIFALACNMHRMTGRDCWKSSPRCEGKGLTEGNTCKLFDKWCGRSLLQYLQCFCLRVQTAMAFWVLAIQGPEPSQSPEVAFFFRSKGSDGLKEWFRIFGLFPHAVGTRKWRCKGASNFLVVAGRHEPKHGDYYLSAANSLNIPVEKLASFLCFLSALQYCCFLCMN